VTKDDIRLLYEYNRWADKRTLRAASSLTPEQFTRDLGGSFRSVRDTLVHIIKGEWGWLQYCKESSHGPDFVKDLWARLDALFNPNAFPSLNAVQRKWAEVETEQAEFVNCLTDESLEQLLPLRTIQVPLGHLMQHLVNHSTYHRGQVAMMLRQVGAQPLQTDFHLFLLEASSHAAVAQ
jgi:uncharacterized damage-inducible protein DinB